MNDPSVVVDKPEDYLQEVQALYSEWLGEDDEPCEDCTELPSVAHAFPGDVLRIGGGSTPKKKKKKKFRRRLQWRAPGAKPPSRKGATSGDGPNKNNKKAPLLPPSNSARGRSSTKVDTSSVPFGRSPSFAGSHRSNASTKSLSTQKCSNRVATVRKTYSQVSVKSSTPPLARYRWKRRLDASNIDEADEENSLTNYAAGDRDEDDRTHVTIDKYRVRVCTNEHDDQDKRTVAPERSNVYDSSWAPIDEARHLAANIFVGANVSSSPTSVADHMSIPFDEYDDSAARNLNQTVEGLPTELENEQRHFVPDRVENQVFLEQMSMIDVDDRTVSTVDEPDRRDSGPIDIDTCTRVVTPSERRHLRAMQKLGHEYVQNNQYMLALDVFSEILRGQRERHGRRSEQTALAMQNLGAVCMKCRRYGDVIKLCDSACRLRVSQFGPEAPGVASCLSMQGVALLEMKQYPLALASFREALRVRAIELSGTRCKEIEYSGASLPAHPLIVRLLNNIGSALFHLDDLFKAKETFVTILQMQRELKMTDNSSFEVDPEDAHQRLLGVALTLGNLGTIHLRLNELDLSLANYEEAALVRLGHASWFAMKI